MKRVIVRPGLAAAFALCVTLAGAQTSVPSNPQLQEARRAYDATDFEAARTLLTALIDQWTASPDEATRPLLAAAYELRGRTLQNLRDVEGARSDWRTMLLLAPGYVFPVEAGPRALALFEEVRAATVGLAEIVVTPADAEVRVDGRLIADRPARLTLADGPHTVAATHRSHRPAEQIFTVKAGEMTSVTLPLERVQSTLTFTTTPGQVEVFVNGERRGATQPAGSGNGTGAEPATSTPFIIEELPTGRYTLDLRASCFVPEQRTIDVQRPQDIRLDTIRLAPARAEVSVQSNAPDSRIVVTPAEGKAESDMRPPQVLSLCAGPRIIEVRSPLGRDLRRYDLKTGQKEQFAARVRPAFALVPVADANAATTVGRDIRLSAETVFRDTATVTLFVAEEGGGSAPAAPSPATPERRAIVTKTVRDLGAQGLAALSRDAGNAENLTLALWAPGSGKPDVLRWRPADAASAAAVTRRLDAVPPLTRPWLGLLAIDVLDVGVVVASIEFGGAGIGLQPGDVIVSAGGKPLASAADLGTLAEGSAAGQTLPLDVRDRAGNTRRVNLAVHRVPRVIDPLDQTVLPNVLAVSLTGRAQTKLTPVEAAAVRLNLGVAWLQAEAWPAALAELDAVDAMVTAGALPQPVNDAVAGTAAYLRGVTAGKSGDPAAAARAWSRAAQFSGRLLTGSGESIKEAADRQLASLRQPSASAP